MSMGTRPTGKGQLVLSTDAVIESILWRLARVGELSQMAIGDLALMYTYHLLDLCYFLSSIDRFASTIAMMRYLCGFSLELVD